jgi:hypothetical protein
MTDRQKDQGTFESVGETVGGFAGKAAGRATDMAMDVASSVTGAIGEVLGGWWSSASPARLAEAFMTERDSSCREHYRSSAAGGEDDYEAARPLYQFGFVARHNPDYQNRSFREVEPELERAWKGEPSTRYGAWSDVRDYVGYGYGGRPSGF